MSCKSPLGTLFLVVLLGFSSACGSPSSATPTPSPPVVFDFAGLYTNENVDRIEGLRATIMWTVPPQLIPGREYAVSSWIAFAAPEGLGGVSYRIAQVGWMQSDTGPPRLFWEWGTSLADTQRQVGADVKVARPLKVEVDWDGVGRYSFYADNVLLGKGSVSWSPTSVGVFVETHNPAEFLPGTMTEPELITGLEQKVGGRWVPFAGKVLTSRPQFHVDVSPDGSVRIWDVRQPGSP
jgi:hypothetical protein